MATQSLDLLIKDPTWNKVASFSFILFFVFLSDAILSYWITNFLEQTLNSPLIMGIILSFSSLVGLSSDLVIPQLIKKITTKQLILGAITINLLFTVILLQTTWFPIIALFLLAMASWGIYYELLSFAQQQFVADSTPLKLHTATWGLLNSFKSLAFLLGPIIASILYRQTVSSPLFVAITFSLISLSLLFITIRHHRQPLTIEVAQVSLFSEFRHWVVLFRNIWPIILLSLVVGTLDATIWTIGPIWNQKLSHLHWLGGGFLSFFILPFLFMGFILTKKPIYQGKKKLAQIALLFSGVFLLALAVSPSVIWQLSIIFLVGVTLSITYPCIDGVYSDLVARMGRERKHLIGFSNSSISIAYIIGPAFAGAITSLVGEQLTFAAVGGLTIVFSGWLLIVTPRKLKLPQNQIQNWID